MPSLELILAELQVGQAMLRLEDRENVGKVVLSTEEYEDANSFHEGESVSSESFPSIYSERYPGFPVGAPTLVEG